MSNLYGIKHKAVYQHFNILDTSVKNLLHKFYVLTLNLYILVLNEALL